MASVDAPFSRRLSLPGGAGPSAARPLDDEIEEDSSDDGRDSLRVPIEDVVETPAQRPQRSSLVSGLDLRSDQLGEAQPAGTSSRGGTARRMPGALAALAHRVAGAAASDRQMMLVRYGLGGAALPQPSAVDAAIAGPNPLAGLLAFHLRRVCAYGVLVTAECDQVHPPPAEPAPRLVMLHRSAAVHVSRAAAGYFLVLPPANLRVAQLLLAEHVEAWPGGAAAVAAREAASRAERVPGGPHHDRQLGAADDRDPPAAVTACRAEAAECA